MSHMYVGTRLRRLVCGNQTVETRLQGQAVERGGPGVNLERPCCGDYAVETRLQRATPVKSPVESESCVEPTTGLCLIF